MPRTDINLTGYLATSSRICRKQEEKSHPGIVKPVDCLTPNLVYILSCKSCPETFQYIGSSTNFKQRWSHHKTDMENHRGEDCGFCKHWRRFHQNDPDLSNVDITFLDFIEDAGPKEEHYPYLKKVEAEWMTNLGTISTINPRSGLNFRDEAKAQGWAVRWSGR